MADNDDTCWAERCRSNKIHCKGLCLAHYTSNLRHGNPLAAEINRERRKAARATPGISALGGDIMSRRWDSGVLA